LLSSRKSHRQPATDGARPAPRVTRLLNVIGLTDADHELITRQGFAGWRFRRRTMLRTLTRPGTAAGYPRATSRGRRVRPGRTVAAGRADGEGARLLARPDGFSQRPPARGAARHSGPLRAL